MNLQELDKLKCLEEELRMVDWLIDHYGEDEDEYFAQLVCEKYDLEEKIAKLRRE